MVITDGQKKNNHPKYDSYKRGAKKLLDLSNFIFKKSITAVQKEISKIPNGAYSNSMMIDGFEDPIKLKKLQRIYWFTIEFGLIKKDKKFKIYGAGIISSKEESNNVLSNKSLKKKFNVKKVMDHSFRIDVVQDTYYYISSFKELTLSLNEIRENIYE